MKKQILVNVLVILIVLSAFFVGAAYANSLERTAPAASWECPAGQVCHVMISEGSNLYILCADCEFGLEENGVDSWLVVGEGGSRD